jgi:hypothetical protein
MAGDIFFLAEFFSAFLEPARKRGFDYLQGTIMNGSAERVSSNRTGVERGEGLCV